MNEAIELLKNIAVTSNHALEISSRAALCEWIKYRRQQANQALAALEQKGPTKIKLPSFEECCAKVKSERNALEDFIYNNNGLSEEYEELFRRELANMIEYIAAQLGVKVEIKE